MNLTRSNLLMMGVAVAALGVTLGTFLWVKLPPRAPSASRNMPVLEGLNRYGAVPEFALTERSGKKISLVDLQDRIWVVDFIYTTCTDTCPTQSAAMARLQERLDGHPRIAFVSISVDPEHDTPPVLSSYARRFNASEDRWLFLTGDKEQIAKMVQQGFRLSAVPVNQSNTTESVIIHSPRFVLVDRHSQIRGYYDSRDAAALERLYNDVMVLLNGKEHA